MADRDMQWVGYCAGSRNNRLRRRWAYRGRLWRSIACRCLNPIQEISVPLLKRNGEVLSSLMSLSAEELLKLVQSAQANSENVEPELSSMLYSAQISN